MHLDSYLSSHYIVNGFIYTSFVPSHSSPIKTGLVSGPPDIIVGLLGRVEEELGAGVDGTVGENVLADLPGLEVGHLDAGVVADVDTKVDAVEARGVDAGCQPKAILIVVRWDSRCEQLCYTYVNVHFNKRAVNEDVHLQRLCGTVGEGVGVEVAEHGVVDILVDE
jgi:hypothetical protein